MGDTTIDVEALAHRVRLLEDQENFRYVINPDGETGTGRRYLFLDGCLERQEHRLQRAIRRRVRHAVSVGGHLEFAEEHMQASR